MKIKIEPFLMKKGIKVAKAAIEFTEVGSPLEGFHLIGFTICDDPVKGLLVLFPANVIKEENKETRTYFFLRPGNNTNLERLEDAIIDAYENMMDLAKKD